jgi:hypothetical protein
MKRLMILTIVAALAISVVGCCRAWPRWWGYQGDPCNVYPGYSTVPGTQAETIVPGAPQTQLLPGPAESTSST